MKGLSFSEPMVKAWMDGRKTVTRRLVKPQPSQDNLNGDGTKNMPDGWVRWKPRAKGASLVWNPFGLLPYKIEDISPYHPGETVYIKETWADPGDVRFPVYKADSAMGWLNIKWKSPRFMPEWASRSHALIVSVRPERIRDITNKDCWKEGADPDEFLGVERDWFQNLWELLHKGSWEKNEWCWRIELNKKGK